MNRHLIYFPILLIVLVFTSFLMTTIDSFDYINAQANPSQEQVEPIPPSNNTNQTTPIVFSQ
jgi:hypothetical protein